MTSLGTHVQTWGRMIVVGDRPTFRFAIAITVSPCVFLIVVGLVGRRLSVAAMGVASLAILLPFALRLCCRLGRRRLISFTHFRPSWLRLAEVDSVCAEPFGNGSRITARTPDGVLHALIVTPRPWWVSHTDHELRVEAAVEQLRQGVPASS